MKRFLGKREPVASDAAAPAPAADDNNTPASQQELPPSALQGQQPATEEPQGRGQQPSIPRPPPVSDVNAAIGWCCVSQVIDFAYVLHLCESISLSAVASKDAARALRKEIKYGRTSTQEAAVRLTGIMMKNSGDRFKEQVASKKFLGDVQTIATSKKADPAVRFMILRVFSALAYEYQRDAELSSITGLYNKLKAPQDPVNGLPLHPEDPLLNPTIDPNARGYRPSRRRDRLITTEEQVAVMVSEAEAAKGNAAMLLETCSFTPVEEMEGNELIEEFHTKCLGSQQFIMSNLDWATSTAEQSRGATQEQAAPTPLGSNNPFAPLIVPGEAPDPSTQLTPAERGLQVLLEAHQEIIDALKLYDERKRMARDQRELQDAQERSKSDTRFDRQTLQSDEDGEAPQGSSGGRQAGGSGGYAVEGSSSVPASRQEPSEKALGKLRQVSMDESSGPGGR